MPEQQMDEEQLKALQEKIKQMSPEELKEFQKKQCIFCQIISGRVQSKKIFEDELSLGILDINPSNPGHVLLLPKEHYSIMPQIPENEIIHLFQVTKSLSNAVLRALEIQGTNIIVANGVAAGQRAQHFMIHIIPRKENDGLKFELPQKTMQLDELEEVRKKLVENLSGKVKENVSKLSAEPKKIVEAEFKDKTKREVPIKKNETIKETPIKSEKTTKEKTIKKSNEKNKSEKNLDKKDEEEIDEDPKSKEGINLDDIAKILGAK